VDGTLSSDPSAINDCLEREVRPLPDIVETLRQYELEKGIPTP
jgi:hypothetical protein